MATYPAWTAGTKITAAKLNYGIPSYVVASSQQGVDNSTTMVDDSELTFTAEANASYIVEFYVAFQAGVNCDVRTDWVTPSGSSGLKQCFGATTTAAAFTSRDNTAARVGCHGFATDVVYQLDTGGLDQLVWERGYVAVGATAGAINLRFAQGTATVGAVTRDANSYMVYKRIA